MHNQPTLILIGKKSLHTVDLFLCKCVVPEKISIYAAIEKVTGNSGGSRPSAKDGTRLTMNVEFCKDNSGTSKKMRYFFKNKVAGWAPWALPWIRHWEIQRGWAGGGGGVGLKS